MITGLAGPRMCHLSMMDDAFDDQYIGCANKMEKKAGKLLKTEMSPFSQMWEKATEKWNNVKTKLSPPKGFKDEYGIAIVAYTDSTTLYNGKAFPTIFNVAVRTAGISQAHYTTTFQFKAFHYYLTIALQLLRKSAGGCDVMYNTTVYRGVPESYKDWNSEIRFGHFASSSIEKEVAERFRTKKVIGRGTLFTIQTCFGVKIWNYSYNPLDKEVLIPVHEKFSVTQRQGNNITLRSTNQTCSRFNCAYLGGEYWAEQEKYLGGVKFTDTHSSLSLTMCVLPGLLMSCINSDRELALTVESSVQISVKTSVKGAARSIKETKC
uniref:NAD(P)(+)--arginine ADP-ribosyltransferase n=1 Tax=Chelydra serpentina TaxID=8475 RepID=A0A8C3SGC5_CHESE